MRFKSIVITLALLLMLVSVATQTRDTLPASLSDSQFWAITESMSEPDGFFRAGSGSTDNLLSNENQL